MTSSPLPTSVLVTIDRDGTELVRCLPTRTATATCTFAREPGGLHTPGVIVAWEIPGIAAEGQVLLTPQQAEQLGTELLRFAITHRVGELG